MDHPRSVTRLLEMQPVQEAMSKGRNDKRRDRQERDPGIERVDRGKNLGRITGELIHRSHSGQDHRGIEQRIDPAKAGQRPIPENPREQRDKEESGCSARMS